MHSVPYSRLLRENRPFRLLWLGQVISELGTWFSFIAELGLVARLSSSPLATTALLVSRFLPVLLFAPLAGVMVDRFDRRRIMIVADLVRAVLALGFLTAAFGAPLWFIVLLSGTMTVTSTFFDAAKNGSVAAMVTPAEMLTANVLIFSTRFLQLTLGAALGGLTAAHLGYEAAFIINSLSFIASALFVWRIPVAATRGVVEAADHFLTEVRKGLAYIATHSFVRAIILVNITWAVGGGMANLLFDRLARHVFSGPGDVNLAWIYTSSGGGLLTGMLLARRAGAWATTPRRAAHFIGWTLLVQGGLFAVAGVMPTLPLFVGAIFFSRLLLAVEFGVQETMMMRVLPDNLRGRVFTTDRALELTTMSLSMFVAGGLLTRAGVRPLVVASGLLAGSPGLLWLLARWRMGFEVPWRALTGVHHDQSGQSGQSGHD
jgi:MFS family permease